MRIDRTAAGACAPFLPADAAIRANVEAALAEDIGGGDVTAHLVPPEERVFATVIAKEPATLAGAAWFSACFAALDPSVELDWIRRDGERFASGDRIVEIRGHARAALSAERSALNFLQTLSATATAARAYADALAGTRTRVLDTRKTLPGLRLAQKYAVRVGGGVNHRIGLYDAVLIKENHIAAAGSIAAAVAAARRQAPGLTVEVEVENRDELDQALSAGVDRVMLDDFAPDTVAAAVAHVAGRCEIEVSGSVGIERLPEIAATGVDFVSVGALTKHVRAVDFSMRVLERSHG